MSWGNYGFNRQPTMTFRDEFSDKFRFDEQMNACMEAFNTLNHKSITYCVEGLMLLMTPNIVDADFTTAITEIDAELATFRDAQNRIYQEKISKAKLPDLIPKPRITPPLAINQKRFMTARALLERKDLLLKAKKDGFL